MEEKLTQARCVVRLDPPAGPERNMRADIELADAVRSGDQPPTIRVYGWDRPAISVGRRQPIDGLLAEIGTRYAVPGTDLESLPVVRRPTGGGAVLHTLDEVTYALALSRSPVPLRDLPGAFHRIAREILVREGGLSPEDLTVAGPGFQGPFSLCFNAPVCGDLLYKGAKAAGSALRAWKDGLLIQGSLQGLPVERGRWEAVLTAVAGEFLKEGERCRCEGA
jgi:lipoyl(octanoyl) transferase